MQKISLILIVANLLSQSAIAQWNPSTTSESADIYRSGKVGIGTTTPATLLDLGGLKFDKISSFSAEGSISEWQWGNYIIGNVENTSQRALRLGVSNDGFTRAEIFVDNGNRSDGTISFKTTNTEGGALTRMFIHGNGNVGIGTNNPSHTLTLYGEAAANLGVVTNQSSGQSGLYFRIHPLGKDGAITYRNDGRLSFNLDAANGANVDTNEYMTILSNGNVGIGTSVPNSRFHVHEPTNLGAATGSYQLVGTLSGITGTNLLKQNQWLLRDASSSDDWYTTRLHNGISIDVSFNTPGTNTRTWWERDPAHNIQSWGHADQTYVTIKSGNVGIGTINPDTKLAVKGTIHTEEVRVDVNVPVPDYVFEKDYNLLPLSEVEAYVNQNKHLPEVPSAKEMEENGLNLKEMNLLLLKKVEELTLHLIEQNKSIAEQNNKINEQNQLILRQNERLTELEKTN